MAYTKRTWSCGDKITADALNRIEQGIEDAYDKGYECTETRTTIFDGTVTTVIDGSEAYGDVTTSDTVKSGDLISVTFNNTEYELFATENKYGFVTVGASDFSFSEYPFALVFNSIPFLCTPTAGTYSLKIVKIDIASTSTSCFKAAVGEAARSVLSCKSSEVANVFMTSYTMYPVGTINAKSRGTLTDAFSASFINGVDYYVALQSYSVEDSTGTYSITGISPRLTSTGVAVDVYIYNGDTNPKTFSGSIVMVDVILIGVRTVTIDHYSCSDGSGDDGGGSLV